jgi:hypothetical protein
MPQGRMAASSSGGGKAETSDGGGDTFSRAPSATLRTPGGNTWSPCWSGEACKPTPVVLVGSVHPRTTPNDRTVQRAGGIHGSDFGEGHSCPQLVRDSHLCLGYSFLSSSETLVLSPSSHNLPNIHFMEVACGLLWTRSECWGGGGIEWGLSIFGVGA